MKNCIICGRPPGRSAEVSRTRESVVCPSCGARRRDQDQAAAMLTVLSDGRQLTIADAVQSVMKSGRKMRVLEIALAGPFISTLSQLPDYTQGYRWLNGPPTEKASDSRTIVHADLEKLPFADESFDLIVTSEVLPFVDDAMAAHAEVLRVLCKGGTHVASIAMDWPMPAETQENFRRDGDNWVALSEPRLFKSPDGTSIPLRRKFGADLLPALRSIGYAASLRRSSFIEREGRRNVTLMAVRVQ